MWVYTIAVWAMCQKQREIKWKQRRPLLRQPCQRIKCHMVNTWSTSQWHSCVFREQWKSFSTFVTKKEAAQMWPDNATRPLARCECSQKLVIDMAHHMTVNSPPAFHPVWVCTWKWFRCHSNCCHFNFTQQFDCRMTLHEASVTQIVVRKYSFQ